MNASPQKQPVTPHLVIVGHPNQGKSSIVSTLLQDTTIQISDIPGTTIAAHTYPVNIDGFHYLNLTDTPGFENPRKTLHLLQQSNAPTHKRIDAIQQFIDTHHADTQYANECNILKPILQGAGILYIVDGSKPYAPNYEAEIEILRWTGRPRLALINPIESNNYINDWEKALAQSFSTTLIFNACKSEFQKHIQLLRTFATIEPKWEEPLQIAANAKTNQRQTRQNKTASLIAETLANMLLAKTTRTISKDNDITTNQTELKKQLLKKIRQLEFQYRDEIKSLYNLSPIHISDNNQLQLPDALASDLFTQKTSTLFGLSKMQLISASAGTGAITGGIIDAHTGGTSFFLGTTIGTLVGAGIGLYTNDNIEKLDLPLDTQLKHNTTTLTAGPIKNINFPHIIISRLIYFHRIIATTNHANRNPINLNTDRNLNITGNRRSQINKLSSQLQKSTGMQKHHAILEKLTILISDLINQLESQSIN
ncbi:GTP-binding protein Der [Poriferisphaera corsica]|uniref:GTP-binding protein Der n=1 Tax=Poriferisphaera corsica TaxID=2528020 RepID=A0A517YVD8_9BACT|nr:GTPase/DUF3482 domain-containing protein [Poriferisphaera corsica]QDU34184.1 GTP-binding protein Der [Poriferisphaera corsica]